MQNRENYSMDNQDYKIIEEHGSRKMSSNFQVLSNRSFLCRSYCCHCFIDSSNSIDLYLNIQSICKDKYTLSLANRISAYSAFNDNANKMTCQTWPAWFQITKIIVSLYHSL